jgi:hypothetical protein
MASLRHSRALLYDEYTIRSVCCRDQKFPWLDSTFHVLKGSPGSVSRHIFLAAKLSELFECIEAFRSSHNVTLALVWKGIGTTLVRSLSASNDSDKLLQDGFLITLGNDEGSMCAAVLACFPRIDIDAFVDSARELARAVVHSQLRWKHFAVSRMFRIHFLSSGSLSHHLKMGMLA